jgi:beta-galactosidase
MEVAKKEQIDMRHNELNKGWRFLLDDPVLAQEHNYWDKGYPDAKWQTVTIPHDWSVAYPFSEKCSSGTGYVVGGVGWYRLHFRLSEALRGKRLRVVFDGIYKNSQVWCNSYYLGKWPYGYTTFHHDITEQATFGEEENVLAVKVTHTDVADSRWFTGSGITRKVTLVIDEPISIQADSLFFQTPKVSQEEADIMITLTIDHVENFDKPVTVTTVLKEVGHEVAALSLSQRVEHVGDHAIQVQLSSNLKKPKLWSATSPNLYELVTYFEVAGASYLVDQRRVGIRSFRFDPDEGFFINDANVKLKGVCLHHDAGCLGAAVAKNVWKRRLIKIKSHGM